MMGRADRPPVPATQPADTQRTGPGGGGGAGGRGGGGGGGGGDIVAADQASTFRAWR
jgi:hypothetical protein